MSSSMIFIALQCCQCSTMQVKQKKKSSNKWSCAVCNQKQSVQKVFAQGFMAKDLRKFVQSFNMSRKFIDDGEWLQAGTLDPASEHGGEEHELPETKKRTDWTGYLDQKGDHHRVIKGAEQQQEGDDFEPLVVTELEKGMFKKSKLVDNSSRVGYGGSDNNKLFKKPVLPKPQEEPIPDHRRTPLTERNSERNNYLTSSNHSTTKCKATISRAASKWNDYVTEDNGNLELGWKKAFNYKDDAGDDSVPWNNSSILEGITSEQRVEDDIHPDFV